METISQRGLLDMLRELSVPERDTLVDALLGVRGLQAARLSCKAFRALVDNSVRDAKLSLWDFPNSLNEPAGSYQPELGVPPFSRVTALNFSRPRTQWHPIEQLPGLMTLCIRRLPVSTRERIASLNIHSRVLEAGYPSSNTQLAVSNALYALPSLRMVKLGNDSIDCNLSCSCKLELALVLDALGSLRCLESLTLSALTCFSWRPDSFWWDVALLLDVLPPSLRQLKLRGCTLSLRSGTIQAVKIPLIGTADFYDRAAAAAQFLLSCKAVGPRFPELCIEKIRVERGPYHVPLEFTGLLHLCDRVGLDEVAVMSTASPAAIRQTVELLGWPRAFTLEAWGGDRSIPLCSLPVPFTHGPRSFAWTAEGPQVEPQELDLPGSADLLDAVLQRVAPTHGSDLHAAESHSRGTECPFSVQGDVVVVNAAPSTASANAAPSTASASQPAGGSEGLPRGSTSGDGSFKGHSAANLQDESNSGSTNSAVLLLRGTLVQQDDSAPNSPYNIPWLKSRLDAATQAVLAATADRSETGPNRRSLYNSYLVLPDGRGVLVSFATPEIGAEFRALLKEELSRPKPDTAAATAAAPLQVFPLLKDYDSLGHDTGRIFDMLGSEAAGLMKELWEAAVSGGAEGAEAAGPGDGSHCSSSSEGCRGELLLATLSNLSGLCRKVGALAHEGKYHICAI